MLGIRKFSPWAKNVLTDEKIQYKVGKSIPLSSVYDSGVCLGNERVDVLNHIGFTSWEAKNIKFQTRDEIPAAYNFLKLGSQDVAYRAYLHAVKAESYDFVVPKNGFKSWVKGLTPEQKKVINGRTLFGDVDFATDHYTDGSTEDKSDFAVGVWFDREQRVGVRFALTDEQYETVKDSLHKLVKIDGATICFSNQFNREDSKGKYLFSVYSVELGENDFVDNDEIVKDELVDRGLSYSSQIFGGGTVYSLEYSEYRKLVSGEVDLRGEDSTEIGITDARELPEHVSSTREPTRADKRGTRARLTSSGSKVDSYVSEEDVPKFEYPNLTEMSMDDATSAFNNTAKTTPMSISVWLTNMAKRYRSNHPDSIPLEDDEDYQSVKSLLEGWGDYAESYTDKVGAEFADREKGFKVRETMIADGFSDLEKKRKDVSEREAKLNERKVQLDGITEVLDERIIKLDERDASLSKYENDMNAVLEVGGMQAKKLDEREAAVKAAEEKHSNIDDLVKTMTEREKEFFEMDKEYHDRELELNERSDLITKREEKYSGLFVKVNERENEVRGREISVVEKEKLVSDNERQLADAQTSFSEQREQFERDMMALEKERQTFEGYKNTVESELEERKEELFMLEKQKDEKLEISEPVENEDLSVEDEDESEQLDFLGAVRASMDK
jgi:hypothetical protein